MLYIILIPLYSYVPYLAGISCLFLNSPADLCCLLQLTQIPLYINYATIFDYRKFSSIFFLRKLLNGIEV